MDKLLSLWNYHLEGTERIILSEEKRMGKYHCPMVRACDIKTTVELGLEFLDIFVIHRQSRTDIFGGHYYTMKYLAVVVRLTTDRYEHLAIVE